MLISEVSELFDISQDTLRYYERIGLIPPVRRNGGGLRNYEEHDLRWIEYIKHMRNAGVAIDQLVDYVKLFQQGDATVALRKSILSDQRDQLAAKVAELQRTLEMLNRKIEIYDSHVLPMEQNLASGEAEELSVWAHSAVRT